MPMNIAIASTAIVTSVAAAFFASGGEGGHAVGNRFDAGHRGAAVSKRGQQQKRRQRLVRHLGAAAHRPGRCSRSDSGTARENQREDADDEEVGGNAKI